MQLSLPLRLRIPLINVDAPIEAVGISTSGTMSSPAHDPWGDVGWYDAGPGPGQYGSSVIDGHLDRPGGSPAVFWLLSELHTGNEVDVMNSNRQTVRFRVVKIAYYPPQHAPLQEIFEKEDGTYLNLVTSAGDWIPSQHQTTLRLVIYTTLFQ
jgi:sortase (surface protein transpeptidase)